VQLPCEQYYEFHTIISNQQLKFFDTIPCSSCMVS